MDDNGGAGKGGRNADERESDADGDQSRLDRELIELLNELRVVLPGVQVLFASSSRCRSRTASPRLLRCSGTSTSQCCCSRRGRRLFSSPQAVSRIRFRRRDKEALLQLGNRMVILGMGALAVAIAASIFLIADLLFSLAFAVAAGTARHCSLLLSGTPFPSCAMRARISGTPGRACSC